MRFGTAGVAAPAFVVTSAALVDIVGVNFGAAILMKGSERRQSLTLDSLLRDILSAMLTDFLGSIWRRLPGQLRRRLMRIGHRRFTVTTGVLIFDEDSRILLLEHVFRPDSGWG